MEPFEPYRNEPFLDFSDPEVLASFRLTLDDVRDRLGRDYPLVIGGEPVHTAERLDSLDPCFPDRVVGRASLGKAEHVEAAFAAAYEAYEGWSRLTMLERARYLVKLAAIMRRRHAELAAWEVFEAAKNYVEASADVAEAIDFCEYYAREALRLGAPLRTHHYPGE